MFDFIRTHQRLMQLVLLLLILPSFVLIGVSGYTTYTSNDHALVTLADASITTQEFDQARRAQLDQFQRQFGDAFDPAILDTEAARRALLESLIDRHVVFSVANQQRFSVSDAMLRQTIAAIADFQIDGQFSPQRYREWLNMAGLTSQMFEDSQRSELALSRVLSPIAASASVPPPVVTWLRTALTAERAVRLHTFAAAQYRANIVLTQADLQDWYAQHQNDFALPEYVDIQYLVLDEAAAMADLPAVSEDDLQRYYAQNKTRYVAPARVNLSHILLNISPQADAEERARIQARAQDIANRVAAAPATFADVAREVSEDAGSARSGGSLGWFNQGVLPKAMDDAVFALEKGEVSGVVQGPDGLHVFRADDVERAQNETFADVRDKVYADVQRELGAQRYADMASRLTGLVYDNPEQLEPIAQALGLRLRRASGIARERLLSFMDVGVEAASAGSDAGMLNDVRVRRALFTPESLNERHNSGVVTIAPDTLLVALVTQVHPASVPELAKVQDRVRERLLDARALAAARQAGEAALATWRTTTDIPEGFGELQTLSRLQTQGVEKPLLDAIFQAPAQHLPAYVGAQQSDGFVVARIESTGEGSQDAQALLAGLGDELGQTWGVLEQQAVLRHLRVREQVKWLPEAERVIQGEDNAL